MARKNNQGFLFRRDAFLHDIPGDWTDADKWKYLLLCDYITHHGEVADDDREIAEAAGIPITGKWVITVLKLRYKLVSHPSKPGFLIQKKSYDSYNKALKQQDKWRDAKQGQRAVSTEDKNHVLGPPSSTYKEEDIPNTASASGDSRNGEVVSIGNVLSGGGRRRATSTLDPVQRLMRAGVPAETIMAAEDEKHPDHRAAADECERVSRHQKLGWYPPAKRA